MSDNRPIGVFDSGLGGLTVVREMVRALPGEKIIYFGDTGRVPYGDKSAETVTHYARQDERFLLSKDVKLIIAACGTVSSVAAHTGEELPVPFIGVVSPAAKAAAAASKSGRIGVIGTNTTIRSGAYERALLAINPDLQVYSADCPIFVPLVEAGWITPGDTVTTEAVRRYLTPLREKQVDTLILGCTHYPVLIPFISDFMGPEVTLINTGYTAAMAASAFLREKGLFSDNKSAAVGEYYVSDRAESFTQIADVLLGREIDGHVELIDITRY